MSAPPLRVLVVEDEAALRELLERQLRRRGYDVTAVGSAEEALDVDPEPDVVLCDISLPGMTGIDLLGKLRARSPTVECIVLTGQGSIPTAIEAMKLGAYHYLEKPVKLKELELYVQGAGEKRRLARENRDLKAGLARQNRAPAFVGRSPVVEAVREMILKVAPSPAPVLVEGETGTGKDLVARAIHEASPRRDRPMVAINCGALSESLLENELFGHVAGAFTGAQNEQRGLFEVAHGGTLFIDEVAEMSLEIQKKFLRVLENGEFRRLGESRTRTADVRVIAATNRQLKEQVAQGRFREDLYYRLNVLSIRTPALREHPGDIPLLVQELLDRARAHHGRALVCEPGVLEAFQRYRWPGNVRELRNVLERAAVLAPTGTIRLADCRGALPEADEPPPRPAATPPAPVAAPPDGGSLEEVERAHILRVLETCNGNKTAAARQLGVSLRSLYRKLERLGMK
ncbi:MAG: sigma-54 dependent transcriptional regulator [Planctomycetes bacterium]|nr:sigma-54 dependent transcriptional regulator [Planctomycetota bacterium]